mmetsp:Transcript_38120/g.43251  ORF Transcript_38120/g.43251 Transcript_38120/m.43251 type:complete len:226 (+) Transcript_38120:53-730(+)
MGKLKLITNPVSPFNSRAIIALEFKQLPYDVEYYDHDKDQARIKSELNPLGKVPILVTEEGVAIYESLAILEYLDSQYPDTPRIFPSDPLARAQAQMKIARLEPLTGRMVTAFTKGPEEASKGIDQDLPVFAELLNGKTFLGGDDLNIIDIIAFPSFDRMRKMPGLTEPVTQNDAIEQWYQAMCNHQAITPGKGRLQDGWIEIVGKNFASGKPALSWPVRDLTQE